MRRLLPPLFVAALLLSGRPADAGPTVTASGDFALGERAGFGASGSVGWELESAGVRLVPEVGFGWVNFGPIPDAAGIRVLRGYGGVRAQLFGLLGAFAHVGLGQLATIRGIPDSSSSGPSGDLGVTLDFRTGPFTLGPHLGAAFVAPLGSEPRPRSTAWAMLGVHATLSL